MNLKELLELNPDYKGCLDDLVTEVAENEAFRLNGYVEEQIQWLLSRGYSEEDIIKDLGINESDV